MIAAQELICKSTNLGQGCQEYIMGKGQLLQHMVLWELDKVEQNSNSTLNEPVAKTRNKPSSFYGSEFGG